MGSAEVTEVAGRIEVDWRHKGFPADAPVIADHSTGWNLFAGDLPTPVLVIKQSALADNIETVHRYCADRGVSIAPHVKTTMSPEIIRRQLDAGAWAVTVANTAQAKVVRRFGCPRVLIANQVVDPAGIRWLAAELSSGAEIYSLVDSARSVEVLDAGLRDAGVQHPARVLLEVGLDGGRTGCRDDRRIDETLAALAHSSLVGLVGVEGYEGVIHEPPGSVRHVDEFLHRLMGVAASLIDTGVVVPGEVIVSAGGSSFPDRVVAAASALPAGRDVRVVIRSGCYVTHDHGYYLESSPFGRRVVGPALVPALEIWGSVVSRPEPDLAILNFGKRDVSYDLDLPRPLRVFRQRHQVAHPAVDMRIVDLNDQHAYVRLGRSPELEPGDMVSAGLSHPCTVFDKWRAIPVVDERYDVVDAVTTYF